MAFDPVTVNQTESERLAMALRHQILEGRFAPTEAFPSLRQLSRRYDVGLRVARTAVDLLVKEIPARLPEGPRFYPEDQLTDVPERFIVAEMVREQILRHTKDEVPYGVAVLVERFEENPVKNMVGIDVVIHVERDSQKGILVGKGGSMIRRIGQDARKEIERMLGIKVHLELFVRVQKNWTTSGRLMKEFGYE